MQLDCRFDYTEDQALVLQWTDVHGQIVKKTEVLTTVNSTNLSYPILVPAVNSTPISPFTFSILVRDRLISKWSSNVIRVSECFSKRSSLDAKHVDHDGRET